MPKRSEIRVYTHDGCPGGERALSFFHLHDIEIQVKDIGKDPSARDEFQRFGYFATPVIIINGNELIGFDVEEVQHLLENIDYTSSNGEEG